MIKLSCRRILLSLYTLLIASMGIATIVEKIYGSNYVQQTVYGSWWFIMLWGMLAVASVVFIISEKLHRRLTVFMLHVSFLVMLVGALVTHLTSVEGTIHLRVGETAGKYAAKDGVRELPFLMTLTDFSIENYPGTDAIADYRCGIDIVSDGKRGRMNVSMNNIGKASGYRFYQSSYDSDGQGTMLLVAYDPYGIAITYIGYMMLMCSLLLTMCSRHTRMRQLYRVATRPLLFAVFLCAGTAASATVPVSVSKDVAHDFGKIVVHYNGRLCPVNTAACDFVTKLCGNSSWEGYSADEIFVGWMIYYTQWEEQKIIKVNNAEVQKMLGIEGKWASLRDFYTSGNAYKLAGKANDATLADDVRKAVRETDEKIQIISMFYNSEMLRMFPLANGMRNGSGWNGTWHAPGSTELPPGTPVAEFQFVNHAMDRFVECVLDNDARSARMMIAKIRLFQKEKAGAVLPSSAMVSMEILYNSLQSMRWIVFAYMLLSILVVLTSLRLVSRPERLVALLGRWLPGIVVVGGLAYVTTMLVLRWIVSGHVPMSNGYETMLFMSWTTLLLTVLTMKKIPVLKAFGPLVSSFCMLVAVLAVGSPQITHLMPVLQSPLLTIHVALVMIAYALLAIITLIAVQHFATSMQPHDEERMTALSQLLLYPAVALLTMGIFVGAVWANVSWGSYWSWDPKETWALITMMIYAIPLHRSFVTFTPRRYHLYILLSFLTVLMTYFGVNYFLSGMHSYA